MTVKRRRERGETGPGERIEEIAVGRRDWELSGEGIARD